MARALSNTAVVRGEKFRKGGGRRIIQRMARARDRFARIRGRPIPSIDAHRILCLLRNPKRDQLSLSFERETRALEKLGAGGGSIFRERERQTDRIIGQVAGVAGAVGLGRRRERRALALARSRGEARRQKAASQKGGHDGGTSPARAMWDVPASEFVIVHGVGYGRVSGVSDQRYGRLETQRVRYSGPVSVASERGPLSEDPNEQTRGRENETNTLGMISVWRLACLSSGESSVSRISRNKKTRGSHAKKPPLENHAHAP